MTELLLGIDIGTASTKGVLVRPDGAVVARAAREHAVSLPRPGWVEHDPEQVWWTGFLEVSRDLLAGVGLMVGAERALGGVLVGLLVAGVVLVVLLVAKRISRRSYVPFGPFLIFGALWAALIR